MGGLHRMLFVYSLALAFFVQRLGIFGLSFGLGRRIRAVGDLKRS